MNREAIYTALFNKVSETVGIVTSSRKLKHWADTQPYEQPALFQTQAGESVTQSRGSPEVWELNVKLYLYANTQNGLPSTIINGLIDSIQTALKPDITGYQTLDDLVSHCWISGSIETDEGVLGDQGVAIIPINIKVVNQLF